LPNIHSDFTLSGFVGFRVSVTSKIRQNGGEVLFYQKQIPNFPGLASLQKSPEIADLETVPLPAHLDVQVEKRDLGYYGKLGVAQLFVPLV